MIIISQIQGEKAEVESGPENIGTQVAFVGATMPRDMDNILKGIIEVGYVCGTCVYGTKGVFRKEKRGSLKRSCQNLRLFCLFCQFDVSTIDVWQTFWEWGGKAREGIIILKTICTVQE